MNNDFGYEGGSNEINEPVTPPEEPKVVEPTTPLNEEGVQYDENGNPITPINKEGEEGEKETPAEFAVEPGTEIELGDKVYTVDEKGNVVDKDGNIFKEAKDVKDWIAGFETNNGEEDNELNINNIQKLFDITVTDENGNEIEYENTPEGVKAYVEQVMENTRQENYQTAINTLFAQYPFVEDMINYYRANGGSLEGYGQVPDRSNIEISESDEAQQEYIIRTAWKEQGRKGNVDGYIQYLKSTGNLYSTAQDELEALKESDKEYREYLKAEAAKAEEKRVADIKAYWKGVEDIVNSRHIAGHVIPESIVVVRDGVKTTATIQDFFNYMYQVDKDGKSRYNHDLEKQDPKEALEDNILRAYLKFTGGSYSNLVDMAINKKEVSKLVLKSKNNKKPAMSVRKPAPKQNSTNIDLGY